MVKKGKTAAKKPAAAKARAKKPVVVTRSVTIDFTGLHKELNVVIADLKAAQRQLPNVCAIGSILTAAMTLQLLSNCQSSMTLQF